MRIFKFLKHFGDVRFLPNMRRPISPLKRKISSLSKGFLGDPCIEVRYQKQFQDHLTADYFHPLMYYYREGTEGIEKLQAIGMTMRKKMDMRKNS